MTLISTENLSLEKVVAFLSAGQTLVYPTETCYGLGCDATNPVAVERLFAIKERQKDKPMLVIMDSVEMAMRYVVWNETLERLAKRHWPGPLTIVAPMLPGHDLSPGVVGDGDMLAFRVTDHPFAHSLVQALGKPIVSTSANIAAQESPYDIESVRAMFEHHTPAPDMVIDAGTLPHQSPSTIVRVSDGEMTVLRQGGVVVEKTV